MAHKEGLSKSGEITQRSYNEYLTTAKRLAKTFGHRTAVDALVADDFRHLRGEIAKLGGRSDWPTKFRGSAASSSTVLITACSTSRSVLEANSRSRSRKFSARRGRHVASECSNERNCSPVWPRRR